MNRLSETFYKQDAITVAEKLLGKILVRTFDDGTVLRYKITETEAYLGEEDEACHASKGKTERTKIMYSAGGKVYVYLIYGMYWLLNVVTGDENDPQAVLIRGIDNTIGSGRVGKALQMDKSFYGEDLLSSTRLYIEDAPETKRIATAPRVGIDYASPEWRLKNWRFILESDNTK